MQSDEELVLAFRGGSEAAFKALVERYQEPLFKFLCQRVKSPDDAADLLQKTLLQAFLKIDQFKESVSFKAWIYKIALNYSLNHFRSLKRQRIDGDFEIADMQSSGSDNPFKDSVSDETNHVVRQAIDRLPARQKLTMELRVFSELSFEAIAEVMTCPVGTAKANFHHAFKALRNELGDRVNEL